ncbi:MAG: ATP-binding protein [Coprococcus comes]
MNIVIINGSTRKGNTLTTIDAFIKGASEKLDDPDATALQISNMVRDAIKPDITMFLHYETLEENGKKIVAVDIQRGTDRPYYIAKKGMRPEGVYARQGYLAVPATDAAIRQMIKETDGDRFEAMRSMNQELTFETTEKEFQLRKIEFGTQQMRTLKLIDQDGLYSNLAMLLSDQCVHTIKVAVFQGKDQTVFKDRREFAGALMKQMNDVYDYIDFHNQTHATIEKLLRIDVRDYPEIDLEDVMAGISVCRNQDLANVFYRLHLIEAYGTGISKIIGAYADEEEKPVIETTRNAFKIILPNINAMREKVRISEPEAKEENPGTNKEDTQELSSEEEQVLEYAGKHEDFTKNDVVSLLKVSASTAARVIRGLVERNFLKRNGKARNTYYTLQK